MDLYPQNEVDFNLYSYIGIEFENICLRYVQEIFKSTEILCRRRYYIDDNEDSNYIIPDVFIPSPSKELCYKLGLQEKLKIIIDFKRSIYAIGPKDIQYLTIIPHSILIFCILQEEGRHYWEDKIESLLNEMKFDDRKKQDFQSRIFFWSAKNEYAKWINKNFKSKFLLELHTLENLSSIKTIEKINAKLIRGISKQKNYYFKKLILDYCKKFDSLQIVKHLLLLHAIVQLNYCTKQDLISTIDYSQPVIEDILKELLEAQIVKKKIFSEFLPHIYYTSDIENPDLLTFFELSNKSKAKKGVEILVKTKKVPKYLINMTFEELRCYYNIDRRHSIGTMFKICSLFEKEIFLTPEEASLQLGVIQENMAELLRLMNSLNLIESYKIEWEATIKYYSIEYFSEPPIEYMKKYLPELLRIALTEIEKVAEIKITTLKDVKKHFGTNWFSVLQEYGVLVRHKEEYLNGFTPKDVINNLRKEQLNQSFTKVRKRLVKLASEKFQLLVIKRENIGLVGKIQKYYLLGQGGLLFKKEYQKANEKEKQIENAIKILKNKRGLRKEEIREILKEGWTSKLRIYYILQENSICFSKGISIEEGIEILKRGGINLSRTNFIRYLTPFSRSPLETILITRTKKGENTPIESFRLKET